MKVTSTNGAKAAGATQGAKPAASPGFTVAEPGAAGGAGGPTGVAGVGMIGSIDALLMLQEAEGPLGRRRRAVGRAGRLLDVLDEVKLAMLEEGPSSNHLQRLTAAVREQRADTEDEGLEALLNQIETRAAVELAKLETRPQVA